MKTAVILIDESYAAPPGTIHLGSGGWVVDKPERLKIQTNLPLEVFLGKIVEQNAGLLGEGELVLAVFEANGTPVGTIVGVKEYQGHILFSPEE